MFETRRKKALKIAESLSQLRRRLFTTLRMLESLLRTKLAGTEWHNSITLSKEEINLPWFGTKYDVSFGHSKNNSKGLKVTFFRSNQNSCAATWRPEDFVQNYPGNAHGGSVAAVLDEVMGQSIFCETGALAVSTRLTIDWYKPVKIGLEYEIVSSVKNLSNGFFHAKAVLRRRENREVKASAHGFYYQPTRSHAQKLMSDVSEEVNTWFRK